MKIKIQKITSLQNPIIKAMVRLREDKKEREKKDSVLIFTQKIIFDVSKKHSFKKVFISDKNLKSSLLKNLKYEELYLISDEMMKKITGLSSFEKIKIAAEIALPRNHLYPDKDNNKDKNTNILESKTRLLILDSLQDPANVGSLIRTAHALNWDGLILTPKTADPFSQKALRAAMGSTFFLPIYFSTLPELEKFIKKEKITLYLADLEGEQIAKLKPKIPLGLILSSEGKGPENWAKKIAKQITIPMKKDIDSLNVAAAGAILMHQLCL